MFKPAQWFCMAAGVIFGLATLSMPQSASAEEAPTIRFAQSGGPGYYRYDRAPSNDGYVERAPEGGRHSL